MQSVSHVSYVHWLYLGMYIGFQEKRQFFVENLQKSPNIYPDFKSVFSIKPKLFSSLQASGHLIEKGHANITLKSFKKYLKQQLLRRRFAEKLTVT
jgi:hypothetical protein